jgi:nondiscriminating glutamyl-tRNA synthetase
LKERNTSEKTEISCSSDLMYKMNQKPVRVRYAPSPTGYLHIGGARSALFNYLFAKKNKGTFILRVEDTDLERNIEGGELSQIQDLEWLGIVPDESPLKPNAKYAPYRQMERLESYHRYAQKMLDKGHAYHCYCSEQELEASRERQLEKGITAPQYDRRCLHLSLEEKTKFIEEGRNPVVRIRLEDHLTIQFDDLVRGPVSFNNDDIGDWVLIKSNGIPTYNFAVVIDDHLMDITHVFRGEEHLSNTPKQIQVYKYLGLETPYFGHMTIIVNDQGKKLSKRDQSIVQFMSQYKKLGYLPQAIFNFILLLGWAPEGTQEIFTKDQAIEAFDEKRLSSSPSTFDPLKLMWLNNYYIKQMEESSYLAFIMPFLEKVKSSTFLNVQQQVTLANIFKEQIKCGEEIIELVAPILNPVFTYDEESLSLLSSLEGQTALSYIIKAIEETENLDFAAVKLIFKSAQIATGIKGKPLFMPVRLKITGQLHGAEMASMIPLLGKEEVLKRLKA